MLAKIGPCWNWNVLPTVGVLDDDVVPTMSAGIRSGVNWMRENESSSPSGERLDEQRLAEPGDALENDVTARKHPDENVRDDFAVADDDLSTPRAQRLERRRRTLQLERHDSSSSPLADRVRPTRLAIACCHFACCHYREPSSARERRVWE